MTPNHDGSASFFGGNRPARRAVASITSSGNSVNSSSIPPVYSYPNSLPTTSSLSTARKSMRKFTLVPSLSSNSPSAFGCMPPVYTSTGSGMLNFAVSIVARFSTSKVLRMATHRVCRTPRASGVCMVARRSISLKQYDVLSDPAGPMITRISASLILNLASVGYLDRSTPSRSVLSDIVILVVIHVHIIRITQPCGYLYTSSYQHTAGYDSRCCL